MLCGFERFKWSPGREQECCQEQEVLDWCETIFKTDLNSALKMSR